MKKKKLKMNPILKKELVVSSRSIKMSMALMCVCGMLTLIVIAVLFSSGSFRYSYDYSSLIMLFPVLGIAECALISFMVPIITASSISGERERQTLDILLTTPISTFSIAMGKLNSAMAVVLMYVVTSIPFISIAFVLGGMKWTSLFGLILMYIYIGFYVGSVGVFCSSIVKKSIAATILTVVIGCSIIAGSFILYGISLSVDYHAQAEALLAAGKEASGISATGIPAILMFNPYAPVFDFFLRSLSSYSVYELVDRACNGKMNGFWEFIYKAWIPLSVLINVAISLLFVKCAALKISVTRNKKKRKVKG